MSETHIWRAVITQAIADATSMGNGSLAQYERRQARQWFTDKSADFAEVCALAGLDPNAVRAHALDLISKADSADADANVDTSTGKRLRTFTDQNGLTLTVAQWAEHIGITKAAVYSRIKKGLPLVKRDSGQLKEQVHVHA